MTPTRYRHNQQPKLDDLVFTNRDDIILNITKAGALGKSDHVTLLIDLALKKPSKQEKERHNYNKADFEKITTFLIRSTGKNNSQGRQQTSHGEYSHQRSMKRRNNLSLEPSQERLGRKNG